MAKPDDTDDPGNLQNVMAQLFGQAQGSGDGIGGLIMGFLKFLIQSFFPGNDAPNEDPGDANTPPPSVGEIAHMGRVVVNSHAIPKWRAYQQAHHGEAVHYINPVKGGFSPITRDFGMHMHPIQHVEKMHTGVDLKPMQQGGNPDILAAAGGIVLWSGWKGGYGNTVMIGHADGTYTLYGHLRGDKMPEIGSEVAQGQTVGVMGRTGGATAEHLHFEERVGDKPIQPKIGNVLLANGVTVPPYNGHPVQAMASVDNAYSKPAVKPPLHTPSPGVQAQLDTLHLPKFDVAEAAHGAKNAIYNGVSAIGSYLRG